MNVSILIATFGDEAYADLAWSRAYPSAVEQGAHEVLVLHDPDGTLASTRNELARQATGDWLLYLDADDELAPGYVAAMVNAYGGAETYDPLLLTPRVQYVRGERREAPKFWREGDLRHANWLVIGTLVPRTLFLEVGGFGEWPIYEDWALFARCWKVGAQVVKVPEAIYVAHVRDDSRNRGPGALERVETHYAIGRELFPEVYDEAWLRQHRRNAAPLVRRGRARAR